MRPMMMHAAGSSFCRRWGTLWFVMSSMYMSTTLQAIGFSFSSTQKTSSRIQHNNGLLLVASTTTAASAKRTRSHDDYDAEPHLFLSTSSSSPSWLRRTWMRLRAVSSSTAVSAGAATVEEEEGTSIANVEEEESIDELVVQKKSVHLQLYDMAATTQHKQQQQRPTDNSNDSNNNTNNRKKKGGPTVRVLQYVDPVTNNTWLGLNTAKRKFFAFLRYNNVTISQQQEDALQLVTQTEVQQIPSDLRLHWRSLWTKRQLLTDRTEWLAMYPSDEEEKVENADQPTRGGFTDLLPFYVDRLVEILRDEQQDRSSKKNPNFLRHWLERSYGKVSTEKLVARNMKRANAQEQLQTWKHFLEWFRGEFPYYYDRCTSCGASIKEDKAAAKEQAVVVDCVDSSTANDDVEKRAEEEEDHRTFLGYIYPNREEVIGKASRTELYQCHKCSDYTRFPRFNSAKHVIENRKGRCGEYSMLLYRMLRALDHEARWVVDVADHVWAEVALYDDVDGLKRWIHLDPCEAAVDENLLYQAWGKKQTHILGFYAPRRTSSSGPLLTSPSQTLHYPVIEDITANYTSDSWTKINERRKLSANDVITSIHNAAADLRRKLSVSLVNSDNAK